MCSEDSRYTKLRSSRDLVIFLQPVVCELLVFSVVLAIKVTRWVTRRSNLQHFQFSRVISYKLQKTSAITSEGGLTVKISNTQKFHFFSCIHPCKVEHHVEICTLCVRREVVR